MHSLALDGFLNILLSVWSYLTTHGFDISFNGSTFTLTYSTIMIGIFIISLVIDLINKIFWGD